MIWKYVYIPLRGHVWSSKSFATVFTVGFDEFCASVVRAKMIRSPPEIKNSKSAPIYVRRILLVIMARRFIKILPELACEWENGWTNLAFFPTDDRRL